jgi:MSHA biogenesis protein MshJ
MNTQLEQWQEKINQLSLRERVLVLLVTVGVVVMLLQLLLIDPLLNTRSKVQRQIDEVTRTMARQTNEKTVLDAQLAIGFNRDNINRRDQLLTQRERLDEQIEKTVIAMIPPKLMPQVLEDLLAQDEELKLLSLEDRPAVPILEQNDEQNDSTQKKTDKEPARGDKQALYKHAFVLRLQGTYPAVIAYFEKLAKLPWRFHWDDLLYQVEQYPKATITLEVYTVSMSEEWLGV